MNKKPVYIKCPRCELNYIEKKQKMCNICKAELNQPTSFYNTSDDAEDSLLELCPVCKASYISLEDDMCEKCRAKSAIEEPDLLTGEEDDNWRTFLDDEAEDVSITTEDGVEISLSKLEEEELEKDFSEDDDFFEEEEEEEFVEEEFEDDFEELDELDEDELDEDDEDEDFE